MKFHVIAVSRRQLAWASEGVGEYIKRMISACPVTVIEVAQVRRARGVSVRGSFG